MTTITIPKKRTPKKVKLHSYAGEWVAFVGEKIIAHNKNLQDLMKGIDSRGLRKRASVILVPRKDEGPYVLIAL
jgi:hypothetical protein